MFSFRLAAGRLLRTKHFAWFLAVTVAIHFGYALIHQIPPAVDARAYETIAVNLIEEGEYRLNTEGLLMEDEAILKVGPGYEFFLAGIYGLAGQERWLVWGIQALLYAGTLFLVGSLIAAVFQAGEIKNWRKFYAVMLPAALFIDMVQLNGMLLSESLWLFWAAVSLVFFYEFQREPRWELAVAVGVMSGLLYFTRPVGAVVLAAMALLMVFRKQWKLAVVAVLVAVILQMPWIYRNYCVYGKFLPTHTIAGSIDLLAGNYPGNHGEYRSDFALYRELEEENPTPIEFSQAAGRWMVDFAVHNPGQLALIWVEKAVIFWSFTKTGGFWFHYFNDFEQIATVFMSILAYGLLAVPGLAYGIAAAGRLRREAGAEGVAWWSVILLALVSVVTIVSSRYRLTLLPFLIVLAAGFWWRLDKPRQWRFAGAAGGWLVLATVTDLILQYDKFLGRLGELGW